MMIRSLQSATGNVAKKEWGGDVFLLFPYGRMECNPRSHIRVMSLGDSCWVGLASCWAEYRNPAASYST
eukprot:scaffold163854_cov50-Attheya_sp.AAC.2